MNAQNKEVAEYGDQNDQNDQNNDNNNNGHKNNQTNKINLPNKLTIFRIILVPVIMFFIVVPVFSESWSKILAAALFLITSLTDLLDGFLARKLSLVTDFGKFMDPLADKFMVVAALMAITASEIFTDIRFIAVWVTAVVFFRELAVTSLRLVARSSDEIVIAANFVAKLKTLSQCVCIMTVLLEDMVLTENLKTPPYLFSYITMGIMVALTVLSGFVYFKSYWKYIDPAK